MLNRYFLQLSYLGTNYNGWQLQENTPDTVQQQLNMNLSKVLGEEIETLGCGRTDTGVHAREFYAHFDSKRDDLHRDPRQWLYKFNVVLPHDMAVQQIIPVKPDAHARFHAVSRTYEYIISRKKDPMMINRAYYFYGALDMNKMKEAAAILFEYHDFSCFSKSNTQVKTTNCKMIRAEWVEEKDLLKFVVTADRFLRNMVRAMLGTLLEVGQGKISPEDFRKIIQSKNRSDAGFSVPAEGLYLTKVEYPENYFEK